MNDYVDTSKDMSKGYHKDSLGDKKKSYLEPDSIELETIKYLNDNFNDVILIVNCNNPMELDWVKDYPNIHTVINVPGTGSYGLEALPRILTGEVTPSGHLTDTYVANNFSSPAMNNMGEFEYLIDGKKFLIMKVHHGLMVIITFHITKAFMLDIDIMKLAMKMLF